MRKIRSSNATWAGVHACKVTGSKNKELLNEVKNGSFLEDFDQIFFQLCPA
jgi:hypothetical protein